MSAIIFDFDGTLADSFDYVVGYLGRQAGVEHLSAEQKRELKGLSMAGIALRLGFRRWQLVGLLLRGRRRMHRVVANIHPFEGMPAVIQKLHAEGHQLYIVSSNSVRTIHRFLHHYQLQTYFLEIYGGISLFGKAPALRRVLRDHRLSSTDAIYIADELRDMQAAGSLGIKTVAVSWGFAPVEELKAAQPSAIAQAPAEIINCLEQL